MEEVNVDRFAVDFALVERGLALFAGVVLHEDRFGESHFLEILRGL